MHGRASSKFHPGLEPFEARQLLSSSPLTTPSAGLQPGSEASALPSAQGPATPATRLVLSRITNPTPTNAQLIPPFQQVRVQTVTPVTGGTYNLLFISVRNSTNQTFDASSGFTVQLSRGTRVVPILTGTEQWKPGQVIVFYILSKDYYPLSPQVSAGFKLKFGDSGSGIAIPGPSGIYQRIKYNPATIEKIINHVVPFGPGARGHLLGLPDTSINEFTAAKAGRGPHRVG